MADADIGSLVVIEGGKIVGIRTNRHYARNVVLKDHTSPATWFMQIMENKVLYAQPGGLSGGMYGDKVSADKKITISL